MRKSYQQLQLEENRKKWFQVLRENLHFDKKTMVLLCVLFFISRAWLAGGMVPFGIAAFAAAVLAPECKLRPLPSALYALVVFLGTLSIGQAWQALIIFCSMALFYSFLQLSNFIAKMGEEESNKKGMPMAVKAGLLLVLSNFVPSVVILSATGGVVSDLFILMLQMLIVFAAFYIMRTVTLAFWDDVSARMMTNEQLACIAVVAVILLMGLPDLIIFDISVRRLLGITLIMLFSYRGGLGTGAAAGVVVGLLLTTSSGIIALYAFCGFLAGLFNKYKKVGVIMGFVLGNLILSAVLTATRDIILSMYEIGFSVIIFMLIPEKVSGLIKLPGSGRIKGKEASAPAERNAESSAADAQAAAETQLKTRTVRMKRNYAERLRDVTVEKITHCSDIFDALSATMQELSVMRDHECQSEHERLLRRVYDRVCENCISNEKCWECRSMCRAIADTASLIEKKGDLAASDIPSPLFEQCVNIRNIISEMKIGCEIYRVERLWRQRVAANKVMVGTQLEGIGDILGKVAENVTVSTSFLAALEKQLAAELERYELRTGDITVIRNRHGRFEVNMQVKYCGGRRNCASEYLPVVEKVLKRKMMITPECRHEEGQLWCHVLFEEAELYQLTVAVSEAPAAGNIVNGDTQSFYQLGQGRYSMTLSDGMGSGEAAAKQSGAVVRLLELFLESGLGKIAAVSMVGTLLETDAEEVLSATVDMAVFDLYEGTASLLKLGAMPAVLKRGGKLETIAASNPPMGLGSASKDCKPVERKLEDGDFLIFYTDGILEAYKNNDFREMDFYHLLEGIQTNNPQILADRILQRSLQLCGEEPPDDMTVVAVKVRTTDKNR